MANGWTNRGKKRLIQGYFQRVSLPTNMFVALVTSANVPNYDTNVLSDLTEIAAGNGYAAGGLSLTPGTTDFNSLAEDDTNDWADLIIIDQEWIAAGGDIPSSGGGARYAVLTDDNGTVGNRDVYAWWDLGSDQTRADGLSLILSAMKIRAKIPA